MFAADSVSQGLVVWVGGTLIAALILAVVAFVIRKPGRWAWKQLVSKPLTAWVDRTVTAVVEKSPTAKQVDFVACQIQATNGDRRSISDRLDTVKQTVLEQKQRTDRLEESHKQIRAQLGIED